MINLLPDRGDRFSQTNNVIRPLTSCFATSIVQCLEIRGYDLSFLKSYNPNSAQPEDGLSLYLDNDPTVQANWKKWHPKDLNTPAYLWADCMVFAVNTIYKRDIATFKSDLTFNQIISYLERGIPVCFSGKYTRIAGHYLTAVGYDGVNLIICDPYGNTLKNGSTANRNSSEGFGVLYSEKDYKDHSKGYGVKIE